MSGSRKTQYTAWPGLALLTVNMTGSPDSQAQHYHAPQVIYRDNIIVFVLSQVNYCILSKLLPSKNMLLKHCGEDSQRAEQNKTHGT